MHTYETLNKLVLYIHKINIFSITSNAVTTEIKCVNLNSLLMYLFNKLFKSKSNYRNISHVSDIQYILHSRIKNDSSLSLQVI